MNRQQRRAAQRRAAKAKGSTKAADSVVAVHEAGHAVGRFLTAERLGYAIEESIDRIEVNAVPIVVGAVSFDKRATLTEQATTFGPKFSRELMAFIKSSHPGDEFELRPSEVIELIAKARDAGLDVDGWFRAKALSTILGPMAEAKLLGKPFKTVWSGYQSQGDIKATIEEGLICSMTAEQIEVAMDEMIVSAQQEIDRPEVWQAILALADKLKPGRMSGREAVAIIKHVLRP